MTFTAAKGKEKQTATITLNIAALLAGAVGAFNGFVKADDGEENIGTVQLTATDAAKITAKVMTAEGAFSFSGKGWETSEDGAYGVDLTTKKGEWLVFSLDSAGAWNSYQLTGTFTTAGGYEYEVRAQRNAFGNKMWYFAAEETDDGWTLSYAENAKVTDLTVTLKADGSTAIAGKLGALSVKGSGYADVAGMQDGVIYADFAPVVSIKDGKATLKCVLSVRANLWFDRSNEHVEGVGTAKIR